MTFPFYASYLLPASFVLAILALWFWNRGVAYPIILDTHIKKGRSWLYLPSWWKNPIKFLVLFLSPLLILANFMVGSLALWFFFPLQPLFIFVLELIALLSGILVFQRLSIRRRFLEQLDAYFFFRESIWREKENQGKNPLESEINNLAAFKHQSVLRKADGEGQFLKQLHKLSKEATNQRTQRNKIPVPLTDDLPSAP